MPAKDSLGHDAGEPEPFLLETFREQLARFVSGVEQFWDGLTFEYNKHIRKSYKRLGLTCLILQWVLNTFNWLAPQCNIVKHLFYPTVLLYRYCRPQPWDDLFMNTVRQLGCAERSDVVAKPVPRTLRQLQGYLARTCKAYVAIGVLHLMNSMEYWPPFTFLSLLAMYAYLRSKSFQQPGVVIVAVTALLGPRIPARVFEVVVVQQFFVRELLQPYLARVQFKAWEERAWFQAYDVELLGYGFGAWMICSVPVVGVAALPLTFATTAVMLSRSCGVLENSGSQGRLLAAHRSGRGGGGVDPLAKTASGGGARKKTSQHQSPSDLQADSARDVAEGRHPSVVGDWDAFEVQTLSAGAPGRAKYIEAPEEHTKSKLGFHAKVEGIKMPITPDQVAHDQRYALEHPPIIDTSFGIPPLPWPPGSSSSNNNSNSGSNNGGSTFGPESALGRFPMMPHPPGFFGMPPPMPMPMPPMMVPPVPVVPTAATTNPSLSQPSTSTPPEAQRDGSTAAPLTTSEPADKVAGPTAPLLPPSPTSSSTSTTARAESSGPSLTSTSESDVKVAPKETLPAPVSENDSSVTTTASSTSTSSGWKDLKAEEQVTVTPRGLEDLTRYNFSDRKTLDTAPSAPPPPEFSSPVSSTAPTTPPLHHSASAPTIQKEGRNASSKTKATTGDHAAFPPRASSLPGNDGQRYGVNDHHQYPSSNWMYGYGYGDGRGTNISGSSSSRGGGFDAPPTTASYPPNSEEAWRQYAEAYWRGAPASSGPASTAGPSSLPYGPMHPWQMWQDRMRADYYQRMWSKHQRKMEKKQRKVAERQRKEIEKQQKIAKKLKRHEQLEQQKQQLKKRHPTMPDESQEIDKEVDRITGEMDAIQKELEQEVHLDEEVEEENESEEDEEVEESEEPQHQEDEEEYTEDEEDGHHRPASRFWGRGGHAGGGQWWRGGRGGRGRGWPYGRETASWGQGRGGRGFPPAWDPSYWAFASNYDWYQHYGETLPSSAGVGAGPSSHSSSSLSHEQDKDEERPTPPPKDTVFTSSSLPFKSSMPTSGSVDSSSKGKEKQDSSSKSKSKSKSKKKASSMTEPDNDPFENGLADTLSRNVMRIEDQINRRMEKTAGSWAKRVQQTAVEASDAARQASETARQAGEMVRQASETAISNAMANLPAVIKNSVMSSIGSPSTSSTSTSPSSSNSVRGNTK
ncbi:hypothetical protein BGW42_001977 [Actinomortierella wolfii]|nr:hypothetical protein BGW42_001977 [Actinomortierella wolfii]